MPNRAMAEVLASTSQATSRSNLSHEKVDLAVKLQEVSSRIAQVLYHRSSSILLTFTNAPDLYTASARFVVAFPLEYSPKVYQSVDRQ